MRKRISIVLTLCLALCMTMVMTTECFASMPSAKNEIAVKKKIETTVKKNGIKKSVSLKKTVSDKAKKVMRSSGDWIMVFRPDNNKVFYRGEYIYYYFKVYDVWVYWWAGPEVGLWDEEREKYAIQPVEYETVDEDSYNLYDGYFNTSNVQAGNYSLYFCVYPYEYSSGVGLADDWYTFDLPDVSVYCKIKNFKAPSWLKAKAGKRKVTIKYGKADGAQKYEIFRSTKRSRGYKKIKTTSSRKFVDKRVKRGKKYFYKVRSYRNINGMIRSSFSRVKRTKRVR